MSAKRRRDDNFTTRAEFVQPPTASGRSADRLAANRDWVATMGWVDDHRSRLAARDAGAPRSNMRVATSRSSQGMETFGSSCVLRTITQVGS